MKNSKEYAKKVQKLYRSLKRKYPKVQKVIYDEPMDALIYAIVSENMDEAAAQSAIKRFSDYFVDLNDLRVSRMEEIVELLGQDTPFTRNVALALTRVLATVFNKYNAVSLKALKKIGKRPARQALEKIDGISRFVVDYCVLTSLQSHAIPLTEKMIEYLRSNQLVHVEADQQQIEGFLAKQISAENAYRFYALLRCQSELRGGGRKKRTTRKVKNTTTNKSKSEAEKAEGKSE